MILSNNNYEFMGRSSTEVGSSRSTGGIGGDTGTSESPIFQPFGEDRLAVENEVLCHFNLAELDFACRKDLSSRLPDPRAPRGEKDTTPCHAAALFTKTPFIVPNRLLSIHNSR